MFPMKCTPGAPSRRWCTSFTKLEPFDASSPIDSRPTRGLATPKRCREKTVPICANCTSHSGWHSAFAPASRRTVGVSPGTGSGAAIAGRDTPRMRPMRSSALAIVAPVFPALTIADALPSRTASAARTSDESFLRLTPCAPSSPIPMISVATMCGKPLSATTSSGPTRTTGMPSSSTATRAPARTSSGAWSPPTASSAIGSTWDPLAAELRQSTSTA